MSSDADSHGVATTAPVAILRAVRPPPNLILRGLLKFVAVVIAAGAVGVGVGIALAELSGNDASTPALPAVTSTAAPTATSNPATTTTTSGGSQTATTATTATDGDTTGVEIQSAVLFPAATESGQASGRARVIIRVRVTSAGAATLPSPAPQLIVGADRVSIDRRNADAAGGLLEPLAPESSATGELQFEIAGEVARRLRSVTIARLRVFDRIVGVRVRISETPAPEDG